MPFEHHPLSLIFLSSLPLSGEHHSTLHSSDFGFEPLHRSEIPVCSSVPVLLQLAESLLGLYVLWEITAFSSKRNFRFSGGQDRRNEGLFLPLSLEVIKIFLSLYWKTFFRQSVLIILCPSPMPPIFSPSSYPPSSYSHTYTKTKNKNRKQPKTQNQTNKTNKQKMNKTKIAKVNKIKQANK